jgi:hypothetical protein
MEEIYSSETSVDLIGLHGLISQQTGEFFIVIISFPVLSVAVNHIPIKQKCGNSVTSSHVLSKTYEVRRNKRVY